MTLRLRGDRREERKTEALERNQAWASLSPQQKIASLDGRLGKDVGAKRQRTKLEVK